MPEVARLPSKKMKGTYDPSRVKSSIPGAGSTSHRSTTYQKKKKQEQAASYVEELKRVEVTRAVKLEKEQEMTQ